MKTIGNLQEQIAVSLFLQPATLEELMERDFLKNIADFNVDRLLFNLERKKWIYEKKGKYYTYVHIAKTKLRDYDLI